ncbi:MAG: carbohydrate binding domain-containing protein, partial [Muribaculaceae bacterium]|nr:carbohydrate binding domain-containing protein [Muribaculaceae bacterium]
MWSFLGSDYGSWGTNKRMHNVRISQDNTGKFWVVFNPDKNGEVVAYTCSDNFETWLPQEYRRSDSNFMTALPSSLQFAPLSEETVQGNKVKGTVIAVDSDLIDRLNGYVHYRTLQDAKNDERMDQDPWRFKNLKPLKATVTLDKANAKPISDEFIGIFFEDINYAADGGLYAELIQNRDFEYSPADRKEWTHMTCWNTTGDLTISISDADPIHINNRHYATLKSGNQSGALTNNGFDGITIKKNEKYIFSVFAKANKKTPLTVNLTATDGKILAQTMIVVPAGNEWIRLESRLTSKQNCNDASLKIELPRKSEVNLDMVSLFPENP